MLRRISARIIRVAAFALAFSASLPALAGDDLVASGTQVLHFNLSAASTDTGGPVVDGLQVALQVEPVAVKTGNPIELSLEVRNVSSVERELFLTGEPCAYTFRVTTSAGAARTLRIEDCTPFSGHPQHIQPGNAALLRFRLPGHGITDVPGGFSIAATSLWWYASDSKPPEALDIESNPVNVQVYP